MFKDFCIKMSYTKPNLTLKIYWKIRKAKLRVSNSPEYMKYILITVMSSITFKVEDLLKHATVNTWAI